MHKSPTILRTMVCPSTCPRLGPAQAPVWVWYYAGVVLHTLNFACPGHTCKQQYSLRSPLGALLAGCINAVLLV